MSALCKGIPYALSHTPVPGITLIPGLGGSGAAHWQTRWQAEKPGYVRIAPSSWDEPRLDDWMSALDRATADRHSLLVAHSLGCLLAIEWARQNPARVAGLFLVALPDAVAHTFPLPESPFASIDLSRTLPVPVLIIASEDDHYCDPDRSAEIAEALGAVRLSLGALGHINASSNLGDWRDGHDLLVAFTAGLSTRLKPDA